MSNHIAAIHVLKSQLCLSDDDYRALLVQLTGHNSSKLLADRQREAVRNHLQGMAERMGVAKPARGRPFGAKRFADRKAATPPKERKVWALWNQLHRDGRIQDNSAAALNAWVSRTVQVAALVWCNDAQLVTLIEALKRWVDRPAASQPTGGHHV
jgi:phage gp16-like protein